MGVLLRCTACTKEMVLEAYHAGRTVPCPWCRAANEIPQGIDFHSVDRAQAKDETRGGTLLVMAVLGFFACPPLAAWTWWSANGVIGRARDDGRPADGLVRGARILAAVGTVLPPLIFAIVMLGS